ncbi:S1 family peptidase [Aquimarina mytili]|uniref:Trypsin-like peptidase domain-containing protein n=1 Tax=Aquimarina mytili TaxID=874423 RepID=A0A937A116_9FLAO|nr:serine protease [Aquimarina mytili]MBL0686046.1 trypsin-like peptidase domain-containing protein [Aquimarina mytili]
METQQAREYYNSFGPAVAYVEIENKKGDIEIGTAYHVGEGVFVTARHVVDVRKIKKIGTVKNVMSGPEENGSYTVTAFAGELNIVSGPFFHSDENVDLACFMVDRKDLPAIPLGGHLDDWLGDEMVLHSTLILGYPRIPMSGGVNLFAAIAEVNTVVDKYTGGHPHFILSCMARGGFSGGVSINEYGFAMGVIVESLINDHAPAELGYFAVISVEPIYTMLSELEIMPECVKEMWYNDDGTNLWDKDYTVDIPEDNDEPF